MGVKKIARPLNKAKNEFIKWLKKNKATNIEIFEGTPNTEWDYYRSVEAFIGEDLYVVYFMMWQGKINIEYRDGYNSYEKLSIDEFLDLLE